MPRIGGPGVPFQASRCRAQGRYLLGNPVWFRSWQFHAQPEDPKARDFRETHKRSWKKFHQLTTATNQSPKAIAANEAAEWLARLHENGAGAEIEQQFMTWLQASPLHVEAYLVVAMATPAELSRP